MRRGAPTALATLCVAAACSDTNVPDHAIRTDSAGVEIVVSSAGDRKLSWQLVPERTFGGEDEGPLAFYRVSAARVAAGPDGVVYVLDAANSRVVALDPDAGVRWTAGGAGGGPGELLSPNSLTLGDDGVVRVHDTRKAALVAFAAADGRVLEQTALPLVMFRVGVSHVESVPGGLALLAQAPYSGSDDRPIRLLRIVGADTVEHFRRAVAQSRTAQYPACGMTLTLPVLFTPQLRWTRHQDRIAAATAAAYVVDVFASDGVVTSIRRPIAPIPVSRADALEAVSGQPAGGPLTACSITGENRLDKHGYASEMQVVHAVAYDNAGRLWVQRRASRTVAAGRIDVFDPAGEYLGTLPEDTPFPVLFLPDGRVGYAERDDYDVDRLVIARIQEAGPASQAPPPSRSSPAQAGAIHR
jgi:hypothetical protein